MSDWQLAPHRTVCIEDLRQLATRRLPRVLFDYIDGGAEGERTLAQNTRAFEEIVLRPRSAVSVQSVDLHTNILGHQLNLPFVLAPVGSTRLFFPRGEQCAARAATSAGTAYTLSTLSGTTLEEVRQSASGPLWYQLYLVGGREVAQSAIARARAAGYTALVVTIDTPVSGFRERDARNGMQPLSSGSLGERLRFLPQFVTKPSWVSGFIMDGRPMTFPNIVLPTGPMPYADVGAALAQSAVTWNDFRWIHEAWQGPIVVKGVHTAADAYRAVEEGAAAIVVSNHGGRQLDGVAATLHVLPEVVAAVGDRVQVLMDGGIRRGSDIVKAMALGAKAVLVGRAYAYGVAAAGEPGARRAIDILRTDLMRTMALLGCPSLAELDESYITRRTPSP
ncbi:MAG: alpha-hydroxy-acid oxidizing protein [Acidobacteriaceae bacterium]|jgi:L-lactate dehydrogenase (cytochrome)|nr:alpha-hydroxy-acid oxidizing protein [Acidobacteriaceae bacterium]